ncbi:hypothetical protein DICPUDRAFT_42897 [Dictyostelium purpureum]|uniref:Peptidase M66 domain-containing protein n=1 Tax=Dictyostelium purpureum TaxID=5786 RepID=F1A311_DICPU|nr:uncharacterized protein DICPUDRAFT_42897 [Dictyostelium purpureum]EGC29419.1 hypothetical protein DICPUDRAFT_42897 [Dictyostelium purpureum]|eukprot:XP_003294057.1 hypothetical protein DICPUDRAFT_42897 [Dictyostelium purpureum]
MRILIFLILLIFIKLIQSNPLAQNDAILSNGNDSVLIAQTHVIPVSGKKWVINNVNYELKIVPNRDSLILAKFNNQNDTYIINVYNGNNLLGSLEMKPPSQLPPTEDNGPKYSTEHHNILIPGNWIKKNMKIQFENKSKAKSDMVTPNMGQEREMLLWTLPAYFFGANDSNTQPFSNVKQVDQPIIDELIQKWAVSGLKSKNHPLGKIDWPYLIMPPRSYEGKTYRSMKITNSDMKSDGYAIMNLVVDLLGGIRKAFGESSSSIQIYTPLLHLGANGKYADPWGGLGAVGGSVGTGDYTYRGIFIHEQGHCFGMPHAEEAYNNKKYPYVRGSLKGSEWAFDTNHNEFISIYIPKTAEAYPNCKQNSLLSDDGKYCIKQSVMQSGAGDQSSKYRFSIFSDFEMTTIQKYFENAINYDGNTGKYNKWNTTSEEYYEYKPVTKSDGLFGNVDEGTPIERDVDVYTIVYTYSVVGPNELNQFYPIIKSKGNLIRYIDPTNKTDVYDIIPFTDRPVHSYCYGEGCDYTLRVTYADGSKKHILISQGTRKWGYANKNVYKDNLNNPFSGDSFITGVYNVKADKPLSKVELLDTPMGWNGVPDNAKVLASRNL